MSLTRLVCGAGIMTNEPGELCLHIALEKETETQTTSRYSLTSVRFGGSLEGSEFLWSVHTARTMKGTAMSSQKLPERDQV